MNSEKSLYFKGKIIQSIEEVEKSILILKEAIKPIKPDNAIGRLSRMEAINAKGVNEKLLQNKKFKLIRLQHALKRVDTEDFGLCAVCEEDIEPKRLEILPESVSCIKCAEGR